MLAREFADGYNPCGIVFRVGVQVSSTTAAVHLLPMGRAARVQE